MGSAERVKGLWESHGINTAHEKTVLNKTAVRNSLEIEYELVPQRNVLRTFRWGTYGAPAEIKFVHSSLYRASVKQYRLENCIKHKLI